LNGVDAKKLKLLNAYYEEAKQNVLLSQSFSLIDPKEYFASAVSVSCILDIARFHFNLNK
jgi:hypothetical protein